MQEIRVPLLVRISDTPYLAQGQKLKKQTNKLWITGTSKRVHWGEDLFSFFLAAPCGLWDLSSLTRNWTQTTAVKPRNPNHWATSCWGFFVPLYQPLLELSRRHVSLASLWVYEIAFTQILVDNVYSLGIHVALSGWVVQAQFEWMVKKECA